MAKIVNMHEAKTHLSKLVAQAAAGEEVLIARNGKPVVKLVPVDEHPPPRELGFWRGQVWIADDFDKPDEELTRLFEEGPVFPAEEETDE